MLTGVLSREVPEIWPHARPWIEKGLTRRRFGAYTLDDVYRALINQRMQLWLYLDGAQVAGAGLTLECPYPRYMTVQVVLWAARPGLRSQWRPWLAMVERWAASNGARAVEVIGRRGWIRVLPDYTLSHVVLRKELRDVSDVRAESTDLSRLGRRRLGWDTVEHADRQQ